MSDSTSIFGLLEECFAGEWGAPPDSLRDVAVLRSTNFGKEGRLDLSDVVLRQIEPTILENKRLRCGDTLLEKSGGGPQQPVGRVVYFESSLEAVCSNFIQVCRPKESNDPRFVFYLLDHLYREGVTLQFQQQTTGLTNLKLAEFLTVKVRRPIREVQEVVACILYAADQAIEQTETLLAKQQRIKTGLMHDLLTRGLDVQGQLRPSVEEANDLYWHSPVGWIPKAWSVDFLDNCASRITVGLATSVTKYYRDSGIRMIRNMNIRRGYFEGDDMVYLDPEFASRFPTKLVQERDVLTCRTGSNVGDTCLVPAAFAGSHTFTTLITTTIRSKLVPQFLVDYMASEIGTRELGNILVGAGKENLNARQLAFLRVRRPPTPEQEQIHLRIESAKDSLNCISETREKLVRIKTGLMNDLLTARVPVTPLLPNFKD